MQCDLQSKGKLKGKRDVQFDCGTEIVVKKTVIFDIVIFKICICESFLPADSNFSCMFT